MSSKRGNRAITTGKRPAPPPVTGAEDDLEPEPEPQPDEDDSVPAAAAATSSGDSRHKSALMAFRSQFRNNGAKPRPAKVLKTAAGGGASVRGVVLRTKDFTVTLGDGRRAPKRMFTVFITSVDTKAAPDVVCEGPFAYMLPTAKQEAEGESGGPEGGRSRSNTNGSATRLSLDADFVAAYLGVMATSLFVQGNDGQTKSGMSACTPGMPVELYGVRFESSKDPSKGGYYLNAQGIRPDIEAGMPATGATAIVQEHIRSSPTLASNSALLFSTAYHTFYDAPCRDRDKKHQMTALQNEMARCIAGIASACETKAASIRAADSTGAMALDQHVAQLRATDPAAVARGAPLFRPHREADPDYPMFVVAFEQSGVCPAFPDPAVVLRLFEEDEQVRAGLPKTFADISLKNVVVEPKKTVVHVEACGFFIGDMEQAVQSINDDGNPVLQYPNEVGIGFKLLLRELARDLGIKVLNKAETAVQTLLPWADAAMFLPVTPRAVGDTCINVPFASGFFWDVAKTVAHTGVMVSEDWSVEHLANGNPHGSRYNEPEGELVSFVDKEGHELNHTARTVKKHGFAACSEMAFGFSHEPMPLDKKKRVYYVIYPGVADDVAADPSRNRDAGAGELAVKNAAKEANCATIASFLAEEAIVYCIAFADDE